MPLKVPKKQEVAGEPTTSTVDKAPAAPPAPDMRHITVIVLVGAPINNLRIRIVCSSSITYVFELAPFHLPGEKTPTGQLWRGDIDFPQHKGFDVKYRVQTIDKQGRRVEQNGVRPLRGDLSADLNPTMNVLPIIVSDDLSNPGIILNERKISNMQAGSLVAAIVAHSVSSDAFVSLGDLLRTVEEDMKRVGPHLAKGHQGFIIDLGLLGFILKQSPLFKDAAMCTAVTLGMGPRLKSLLLGQGCTEVKLADPWELFGPDTRYFELAAAIISLADLRDGATNCIDTVAALDSKNEKVALIQPKLRWVLCALSKKNGSIPPPMEAPLLEEEWGEMRAFLPEVHQRLVTEKISTVDGYEKALADGVPVTLDDLIENLFKMGEKDSRQRPTPEEFDRFHTLCFGNPSTPCSEKALNFWLTDGQYAYSNLRKIACPGDEGRRAHMLVWSLVEACVTWHTNLLDVAFSRVEDYANHQLSCLSPSNAMEFLFMMHAKIDGLNNIRMTDSAKKSKVLEFPTNADSTRFEALLILLCRNDYHLSDTRAYKQQRVALEEAASSSGGYKMLPKLLTNLASLADPPEFLINILQEAGTKVIQKKHDSAMDNIKRRHNAELSAMKKAHVAETTRLEQKIEEGIAAKNKEMAEQHCVAEEKLRLLRIDAAAAEEHAAAQLRTLRQKLAETEAKVAEMEEECRAQADRIDSLQNEEIFQGLANEFQAVKSMLDKASPILQNCVDRKVKSDLEEEEQKRTQLQALLQQEQEDKVRLAMEKLSLNKELSQADAVAEARRREAEIAAADARRAREAAAQRAQELKAKSTELQTLRDPFLRLQSQLPTLVKLGKEFAKASAAQHGLAFVENCCLADPKAVVARFLQATPTGLPDLASGRVDPFVWVYHGCPTADGVRGIFRNGFDTSRRKGQVFGAGEYFAPAIDTPLQYAKINRSSGPCGQGSGGGVILALVRPDQVKKEKGEAYFVVDNPTTPGGGTYCLPVLALHADQAPLPPCAVHQPISGMQFFNERSQWQDYDAAAIQPILSELQRGVTGPFSLKLGRFTYTIDVQGNQQTNTETGKVRRIRLMR